jgi:flagellar protein FlaI
MEKILRESEILKIKEINTKNRCRYHTGRRSLPIQYLFKNKKVLQEIMKQSPICLTHGGVYVNLPTEINENLAYLAGLICGDGNLFTTEKRDYIVSIHNKETVLLEKCLEIFEKNFNYFTEIRKGHGCRKVEVRSEVIHSFLNKILQIENGRKQNIIIPEKIKKNSKLTKHFIAGFFDAEGSVHLQKNKFTCQISIAQKQEGILKEIQKELEKEEIPTKIYKQNNNDVYRLYGNKSSLSPFLKKIPFIHPKKREKLKTAVDNQSKVIPKRLLLAKIS